MLNNRLFQYGWLPLWLILVFMSLWSRPALPVDETRYLSVAWEMWQHDQFLVPLSNGLPYSHKPPLLFWLIHFGWLILGVNEWSARLTAPLFGLLCIFITQRLARNLWPELRQQTSAVAYLMIGTPVWTVYATLTMFDTLLSCFVLLALLSLWQMQQSITWQGLLRYAIALGLGLLAKGPVVFLYTLPPALLAPWWMPSGLAVSWRRYYLFICCSVLAGLLIALAWAVPAALAGGSQYGQAILWGQTAGRAVQSFAHLRPWYWYLLVMPLLLWPWSCCISVWWRSGLLVMKAPLRFCCVAVFPAMVLLSAVSGKQLHYLLPLVPLVTMFFWQLLQAHEDFRPPPQWLMPVLLGILALALLLLPFLADSDRESAVLQQLSAWLAAVPALLAIVVHWSNRRAVEHWARDLAMVNIALLAGLQLGLRDGFDRVYGARDIGLVLHQAEQQQRQIAVYPKLWFDQFHFAGRLTAPVSPLDTLAEGLVWAANTPQGSLLVWQNKQACQTEIDGTVWRKSYAGGCFYLFSPETFHQEYPKLSQ